MFISWWFKVSCLKWRHIISNSKQRELPGIFFIISVGKSTTCYHINVVWSLLCGLKCGTFLFYLMNQGSVYLSDWLPSHSCPVLQVYHRHHLTSFAALSRPPLADKRQNEKTVLFRVAFVQPVRWNIGRSVLPGKDSENGALEKKRILRGIQSNMSLCNSHRSRRCSS